MPDTPATRPSLLLRVRDSDDRDAWQEFVELYSPVLYAYLRRRGLQDADIADVLQDVLASVARAIREFHYQPQSGRFRAWLYTVTRNAMFDFANSSKKRPVATGDSDFHQAVLSNVATDDEEQWERDWERARFDWAVARVQPQFEESTWQAFWQVAVEGRTSQAAAETLGLSVGAVYIAKSRVTAAIRREIEELGDE